MKKLIELYLSKYSRIIINTVEIQNYIIATLGESFELQMEFAKEIGVLVQEGVLSPIVSRKKYGWNLSLYEGYRLNKLALKRGDRGIPTLSFVQKTLKELHPSISTEYYEQNPEEFVQDSKYIMVINRFLYEADMLDHVEEVSVQQRSLFVFKDEHFLTKNESVLLFNKLGLTFKDLHCFVVYEPFIYDLLAKQKENNLLIVENKDTYFLLRKLFHSGFNYFSEMKFNGLIYGEGQKIESSFGYINNLEQINKENSHFYYFGDIELKKICLVSRLQQKYSEYHIEPFLPFYSLLLGKQDSLSSSVKRHHRLDKYLEAEKGLDVFPENMRLKINLLFIKNRYLAQIALNNDDFKQVLHAESLVTSY